MDNISTQLADLAVTRALVLQRVSNNLSKEVAQAYLSVIDDVTKQLKSGDDINIKNVNKIIKELQSRMEVNLDIESDLTKLSMSEAQWAQSSVNGAVGIDLMSKLPTEATIAKIVGDSYIQGSYVSEWMKSIDDSMKVDLMRQVRMGMIQGEENSKIAKRVKDTLIININHAKTIAKTAVFTISNNARMATYEANDDVIKGWQYQSVLDSRTSNLCMAYSHKQWTLDKKPIGHNLPFKNPPSETHWNCRSLLTPILKSYQELAGLDIEIPKGTQSSLDGQVSDELSFNDWLKKQDKAFINKALGEGRAELFLSGKITMSDLINQQGRTLTLKELKAKYG